MESTLDMFALARKVAEVDNGLGHALRHYAARASAVPREVTDAWQLELRVKDLPQCSMGSPEHLFGQITSQRLKVFLCVRLRAPELRSLS